MDQAENDLLTRTNRGTPCGELMRRYWQPAALSEELPPGNNATLPVRLLGEDLVLFRDPGGRPGLLDIHCSHRGADLSYGRVEDGGLRCIYHGWLYDIRGRCIDQPGEVSGGEHRDSIRQTAYPCEEHSGTIFAYLGPGEPPLFPKYEFLNVPEENAFSIKLFSDCNYLQGNEGNIDLAHLSFLHYNAKNRDQEAPLEGGKINPRGAAPQKESYEVELTEYGLRSYKIRRLVNDPQKYRLYMTEFVLPCFTAFYGEQYDIDGSFSVNWHVPIDDAHHWKYTFIFSRNGPIDKAAIKRRRADMAEGYRPLRNKGNRYQQDRSSMIDESFSGIGYNFQVQDLCVTEGMGPVQDRTKEHLAPMDRPVVLGRKLLFGAIRDLQEGREPRNVIRDPKLNHFVINACNDLVPLSTSWKDHIQEKNAKLAGLLFER
jgi:phthalate 4,5-dioxygenase oxygenase subunit